ncbi:SDR family oxidoreductase [uncultured Cohaesibacter sp.]|uniref:SDR family oxidoreductase n=1 Tax=uncultured Cohaesibacter sp. TaxID=1002546 RepID=UPI0029312480|nr:SDR family oxidoreductase [uncultured Cohaesibacter sp.]
MQNVESKVFIITGASSGIGEETAKVLAKNGAKVVLSARRESRLKDVAATIGKNATYLKSDVADADSMKEIVALAKSKFGKVDAVFANAGIMPGSRMSELKVGDWMGMIDINIKGVLNTISSVLPEFIAQKSGHIVVNSSIAGTKCVPGNAIYCGTKHFVRAMLDSFRTESVMEGTNIRTTLIYPGAIRTELLNTIAPSDTKTIVEEFYRNVALKPDAIANAVLYAVSQPQNVDVSDLVVRSINEQ